MCILTYLCNRLPAPRPPTRFSGFDNSFEAAIESRYLSVDPPSRAGGEVVRRSYVQRRRFRRGYAREHRKTRTCPSLARWDPGGRGRLGGRANPAHRISPGLILFLFPRLSHPVRPGHRGLRSGLYPDAAPDDAAILLAASQGDPYTDRRYPGRRVWPDRRTSDRRAAGLAPVAAALCRWFLADRGQPGSRLPRHDNRR